MTDIGTSSTVTDETASLIAATKVEGTKVYNRKGDNLGSIYDVMIDKSSGHVAYAIMSFGGFLGIGEGYHPLPWKLLTYDVNQGGYVVDLDKTKLEAAPSYSATDTPNWTDRTYTSGIDKYYGAPPYTM